MRIKWELVEMPSLEDIAEHTKLHEIDIFDLFSGQLNFRGKLARFNQSLSLKPKLFFEKLISILL